MLGEQFEIGRKIEFSQFFGHLFSIREANCDQKSVKGVI